MNLKKIKSDAKEQVKPYIKKLCPVVLLNFYLNSSMYVPYVILKYLAKTNSIEYSSKLRLFSMVYLVFSGFISPVIHMAYLSLISSIKNKQENEELQDIGMKGYFSYFYLAGKAIGNYWWTMLWISIWFFTLLFGITKIIINPLSKILSPNYALSYFLGLIIYIIILAFYIYKDYSYSMNTYAIADQNETEVIEAMKISKSLTKGHIKELFLLSLSFFPKLLLIPVTLGVASVWVVPHFNMAYYTAYKELEAEALRKLALSDAANDND